MSALLEGFRAAPNPQSLFDKRVNQVLSLVCEVKSSKGFGDVGEDDMRYAMRQFLELEKNRGEVIRIVAAVWELSPALSRKDLFL